MFKEIEIPLRLQKSGNRVRNSLTESKICIIKALIGLFSLL